MPNRASTPCAPPRSLLSSEPRRRSKRTQEPIWNEGTLPAFANFEIVMRETVRLVTAGEFLHKGIGHGLLHFSSC
jgi:hypothetical protein